MSLSQNQFVSCPGCGSQQQFTSWSSINISLDATLKQQLLSGKLTTFHCKNCDKKTPVDYDLLYHDMNYPLMIWLRYPDQDGKIAVDGLTETLGFIKEGYVFRLATSYANLIEKIKIFDDNQSDLVIEFMKATLFSQNMIGLHQPFYYHGIKDSQLTFVFPTKDGKLQSYSCSVDILDDMKAALEQVKSVFIQETRRWYVLDRIYVLQKLAEFPG